MKANFTLTKETANLFKIRFEKMLSITGAVEVYSIYTGRLGMKKSLFKQGLSKRSVGDIIMADKTIPSFIVKGRVIKDYPAIDSYPCLLKFGEGEGILLRFNNDSAMPILFGQKMHFSPNKITFVGDRKDSSNKIIFGKNYCGARTIIRTFANVGFATHQNDSDDFYSDMYWRDVEKEFEEEFKTN